MNPRAIDLARSAGAGLLATLPMTATMGALFRALPRRERDPLPPRQITSRVLERIAGEAAPEDVEVPATWISHFAYGAGAGLAFGLLPDERSLPPVAKGVAFGLAVWSGSYLGWLPAVGLMPPATRHPPGRVALMIAAHVVWGAALGALAGGPRRRSRRRAPLADGSPAQAPETRSRTTTGISRDVFA